MSDTVKRTVYFSKIGGNVAFYDWTVVSSLNGDMIEPINLNRISSSDDAFDPADPGNIISNMVECDLNKIANLPPFADDGGGQWHGGPTRTKTF